MCKQQNNQSKYAHFSVVKDGQFPTSIPYSMSNDKNANHKVISTFNEKIYSAQKWNDSTLVILADKANYDHTQDLIIEVSDQAFFANEINIKKTTKALQITKDDKPILDYQFTEHVPEGKEPHFKRGGFIHPVYSPSGNITSDDFPEGHTHQHGLFFAFVNTTFKGEKLDFWNQQDKTGIVEFSKILNFASGPVFGNFQTEQNHISIKHGLVLKENWKVIIYNTEPFRIELETTLTNVSSDTLFINDYHYGGMAFRGAKEWNAIDSLNFQNEPSFHTNEDKNRIAANHSRPMWSALSGLINGKESGLAIFSHPTNFRYPEPIRIHPQMPYFCIAPMVGEKFSIAPNEFFKGNYTLISYEGSLPSALLNEIATNLKK